MSDDSGKAAVLLLNMGGPDSPEAIQPFLKNLFSDPAILRLPGFLRLPLADLLSRRRTSKVLPRYGQIGGKSPISEITLKQADALARQLGLCGLPASVYPAFSYWHPFIEESLNKAAADGARNLVALSLYPQYCRATTGSCVHELSRVLPGTPFETRTRIIDSWHDHPAYLDVLAETVREALDRIPENRRDDALILFSAHGVPQSIIRDGDPYLDETLGTVSGVMERLGQRPHMLAFQSKIGPVKWLEPSLLQALESLAVKGAPPLVIVPVSFVSDHIETLYELDIQYREVAVGLGFEIYERASALNVRSDFVSVLSDLILSHM